MTSNTLSGSCLCGAVHYTLRGDSPRFYHCHCKRCRKATGTGHASILIFEHCELSWTQGEASLNHYKVPDAERFATVFCKICGSGLPRYAADTGRAVVPAGSLDSELDIEPEARIFWDSRVDWSCRDTLPAYAEYPVKP